MLDKFQNKYEIAETPNAHQVITGSSGYGKTYQICRRIEELQKRGKRMTILDFSSSFAPEEREKNKLRVNEFVEEFDNSTGNFKGIYFQEDEVETVAASLADIILKVAKIRSLKKRFFIEKSFVFLLNKFGNSGFRISQILKFLVEQEEKLKSKDDQKYVRDITEALDQVCAVDFFEFHLGTMPDDDVERIDLFQLSNLSLKQRKSVAEFLILYLWENKRKNVGFCDYIIVDEIQFLDMSGDSGIASVLREGRKFGLGVILATQFIGSLDKEAKLTLEQVSHRLYLRPTNEDLGGIAKELTRKKGSVDKWEPILASLKVGEGVFSGYAMVNENRQVHEITMKMQL